MAKVWDETPFIQDIKDKKFGLILLYAPMNWDSRRERWTAAQLQAISTNYEVVDNIAETWVYKPKKK